MRQFKITSWDKKHADKKRLKKSYNLSRLQRYESVNQVGVSGKPRELKKIKEYKQANAFRSFKRKADEIRYWKTK